ncbi:hypothetical protein [Micromonospora sp. NPDC049282]|uniref:hypothetical protein n=1 Tax=Micromonospora sp. NPDC049282 TaxID=3364269 RepID=UPI0037194CA7
MSDTVNGPDPERGARRAALVEWCRPLLERGAGMDAVQRFLRDRNITVVDAVVVTRELLGAGPGALGRAKEIVLTSPGREDALRAAA